jgi:hypothetical protein
MIPVHGHAKGPPLAGIGPECLRPFAEVIGVAGAALSLQRHQTSVDQGPFEVFRAFQGRLPVFGLPVGVPGVPADDFGRA